MGAALLGPWAREAHACLQAVAAEAERGLPGQAAGLTLDELAARLGPLPFSRDVARNLLGRMAERGWLRRARERCGTGPSGWPRERIRYYAAAELPSAESVAKRDSYFDGLVRACSVFELAQIVGAQAAAGSRGAP